jgi:NAD(P)-dependent dehydrogenase (short-subunit alcohol dehydrogenase family)
MVNAARRSADVTTHGRKVRPFDGFPDSMPADGRAAFPEEIAFAACSLAASFVTGGTVPVDGGVTAR